MASNSTVLQGPVIRDVEMDTRNEEPHIEDLLYSERRLNEETKLLPRTSFELPDKPRVWPPMLAVMAAKTFTKGKDRRRVYAPKANQGYKNLDSHEQAQNQESHEQGETQQSGGQSRNNHEDPGQALRETCSMRGPGHGRTSNAHVQYIQGDLYIHISDIHGPGSLITHFTPENEENPGQADQIHEKPGQAEPDRESPRQAEIQESQAGQAEDQESPRQADQIQESPPEQAVSTQGNHSELFGAKSRTYMRMRHKALLDQLNSFAVLLVLLAGAMSVAILQPPGSFDTDGHIRKAALPYLIFASISFLLSILGLVSVMLGFMTLSHPVFYALPRTEDTLDGSATPAEIEIIEVTRSRLFRVGAYLFLSLLFCSFAFCFGLGAVSSVEYVLGVSLGLACLFLVCDLGATMMQWKRIVRLDRDGKGLARIECPFVSMSKMASMV